MIIITLPIILFIYFLIIGYNKASIIRSDMKHRLLWAATYAMLMTAIIFVGVVIISFIIIIPL